MSCRFRVVAIALALMVIWPLMARAQASAGRDPAHGRRRAGEGVAAQLRQVLGRLDLLESENKALRAEVVELRGKVDASTREIAPIEQAHQAVQQELPKIDKRVARLETQGHELEEKQSKPMIGVNFYAGYSESPFKLPGGFFYGASVDHTLWTPEEGMPGGTLTGELMVGLIQGNAKKFTLNTALLGPQPVRTFVNTIVIDPAAKYHLDLAHARYLDNPNLRWLRSLEPYALAGPSIFVTIAESPPLTAGQVPLPPQFQGRRFQNVTEADIHPGFSFGAGFRYHLAALNFAPLQTFLDRISLGGEWRQNHFANGETFNQYAGTINLGL